MIDYDNKNLIQYDTVKFRTNIKYLKSQYVKFNEQYNPKNGQITGLIYSSKNDTSIPFDLFIGVSYTKQSMTIEFSSKILLDDYPKLITSHTFRKCLENIEFLGICSLDIDSILQDSHFTKLHVTKDILFELTDTNLDILNSLVTNYRRFKWKHYEKEGITFTKDVKSKDCKEQLTVYNKGKEILLAKNQKFLSKLNSPSKVIQYFNDKTRVEVALENTNKIMDYLDVPDTHIKNIFSSTENPILYQFNRIFGHMESDKDIKLSSQDEFFLSKTIMFYNYELKQIEQELKNSKVYSTRSGLSKKMKQIVQLSTQMQQASKNNSIILDDIRNKLENHTIYSI